MSEVLRKAKKHLEKDPANFLLIRSWVIKSVDELMSDKDNLFMESVGRGSEYFSRTNSLKNEIEEYPELLEFRSFNEKHETEYEPEVICPYCGHAQRDSWEFSDGEYNCGLCDEEFSVTRNVSVTYSTSKIEKR